MDNFVYILSLKKNWIKNFFSFIYLYLIEYFFSKKLKNSFLFSNLFIYLFIILIILIKFDFEIIILKFNLVYPKKKLKKKYQKKLIILIISIYSNIN